MVKLEDELRRVAEKAGVDLFGVGDLTKASSFLGAQGGDYIAKFPRGISVGIRLLDAVVDELFRHQEPPVIYSYRGLYTSVNANLDRAALLVAKKAQNAGFKAYPIPASQTVNREKLEGAISHKLAANLAGLGWIGKNCLLITPDHGPRVRLATILTDAPLRSGTSLTDRCGTCRDCVDICPVKAFTGAPFHPSEPRASRFRAHLCDNYVKQRTQKFGEGMCGLCMYICPFGKPGSKVS